jgi:hypothetical protein
MMQCESGCCKDGNARWHTDKSWLAGAGKDEPEMVERIFSMFGVPTEKDWPEVSKLPL